MHWNEHSTHPCASIIVATFNSEATIEQTLQSALAQTRSDIEILVVDDCSSDGTVARVSSFAKAHPRVRLLRMPVNGGPGLARNRAIAEAKGDWIALLDSDDLYHPERIERMLALAERHGADIVSDNLLMMSPTGEPQDVMFPEMLSLGEFQLSAAQFLRGNVIPPGSGRRSYGFMQPLVRRAFLLQHRLHYQPARFSEDFLFAIECLLQGAKWVVTPQSFYQYRLRHDSLSAVVKESDLRRLLEFETEIALTAAFHSTELTMAFHLHLRSVGLALRWMQFANAVKAVNVGRAIAVGTADLRTALHIATQLTKKDLVVSLAKQAYLKLSESRACFLATSLAGSRGGR